MATRKSAKPTTTSPAATAKADTLAPKKHRADWDAVERDYRTGKFTQRELGAKYGVSHAAVAKQARTKGWTQDLAQQIKQATNAKLVATLVDSEASKGAQAVSTVIQVAAEINKEVILSHRKDLSGARVVANDLLNELAEGRMLLEQRALLAKILAGGGAEPADVAQAQAIVSKTLGIGNRVQAFKALADAITKLHAGERIAFGLDEKDDDKDKDPVSQSLADFFGGIHGAAAGRIGYAPPNKA